MTPHATGGAADAAANSWVHRGMPDGIAAQLIIGCSPDTAAQDSPEEAVNRHTAAAKAGDVAALRSGACGLLAAAMDKHSDPEVREGFSGAYETGPDELTADGSSRAQP